MNLVKNLKHFWRFWFNPIFPVRVWIQTLKQYPHFLADWRTYSNLLGAEKLKFIDSYPFLLDATKSTPFDAQYFYQGVWAAARIAKNNHAQHLDIGSQISFVAFLSTHLPTVFLDFRPLHVKVPELTCLAGDITLLPIRSESVHSLSCLHVVEHIGLGRYGDPLNPLGTKQACSELARVLAPGGNLFFSTPIGRTRTCFNGQRIHHPEQILSYFTNLELIEFSAINDHQQMCTNAPMDAFENAEYSCGLFWFHRTHLVTSW